MCPRCQGFLWAQREDVRCLICGWHHNPPMVEPLASVERKSWIAEVCRCGRKARRNHDTCVVCYGRSRGQEHGDLVRAGMRAAREDGA